MMLKDIQTSCLTTYTCRDSCFLKFDSFALALPPLGIFSVFRVRKSGIKLLGFGEQIMAELVTYF